MKDRIWKACVASLSLAGFSVCAAAAASTVADLLKAENMRAQAEANYDAAALDQDVGSDLVLVHGGGDSIGKAQYLASITQGAPAHFVTGISLTDESGAVFGDIGVTDGIMTNHLKNHLDHVSRYLGVYRYENGKWVLIRWQTTDISRPGH